MPEMMRLAGLLVGVDAERRILDARAATSARPILS